MEAIEKLEKTISEHIQCRIYDVSNEPIDEVVNFVKDYGYVKHTKKEIKDYLNDKDLIKENADEYARYMMHLEKCGLSEEELDARIKEKTLHYSGEKYSEEVAKNFNEWVNTEYEETKSQCLTRPEDFRKDMILLNLLLLY